jgi:hypothetical protein
MESRTSVGRVGLGLTNTRGARLGEALDERRCGSRRQPPTVVCAHTSGVTGQSGRWSPWRYGHSSSTHGSSRLAVGLKIDALKLR